MPDVLGEKLFVVLELAAHRGLGRTLVWILAALLAIIFMRLAEQTTGSLVLGALALVIHLDACETGRAPISPGPWLIASTGPASLQNVSA